MYNTNSSYLAINFNAFHIRKLKIGKDSNTKPDDHIYDELHLYATLNAKTDTSTKSPSPKSDKVIFDTQGIEPPVYQQFPEPRYQICSTTSIAKSDNSNDYYIEKEDARSIKDVDCKFALEEATKQNEDSPKQHESYCKLYHFK